MTMDIRQIKEMDRALIDLAKYSASLGGRSGPGGGSNPLFFVKGKYAFGEFDIDATKSDPELTFRLIMEDGSVHYEIKLTQSQLTPA